MTMCFTCVASPLIASGVSLRMSLQWSPRIAAVCASNQNRSMEAHSQLQKRGFNVRSFGTNQLVRLPGPAWDKPNVYPFGTPYTRIYDDLKRKDPVLYEQNGLLVLLQRNRAIKEAPERFQDCRESFDVVVTFDEPVFEIVVADLSRRGSKYNDPVHVFNLLVKDNAEEAVIGARATVDLMERICEDVEWEDKVDQILVEFETHQKSSVNRDFRPLHEILFL